MEHDKFYDNTSACPLKVLSRPFVAQHLVGPIVVGHYKVIDKAKQGLPHGGVAVQINLLKLDVTPNCF